MKETPEIAFSAGKSVFCAKLPAPNTPTPMDPRDECVGLLFIFTATGSFCDRFIAVADSFAYVINTPRKDSPVRPVIRS